MRALTFSWYALSFWLLYLTIYFGTIVILDGTRYEIQEVFSPMLFAITIFSYVISDTISTKIHPKKEQEDTDGSI